MLSARLEDPAVYSDYVKVSQIQSELEKLQSQQDEYSDEWFTLSEELENN